MEKLTWLHLIWLASFGFLYWRYTLLKERLIGVETDLAGRAEAIRILAGEIKAINEANTNIRHSLIRISKKLADPVKFKIGDVAKGIVITRVSNDVDVNHLSESNWHYYGFRKGETIETEVTEIVMRGGK